MSRIPGLSRDPSGETGFGCVITERRHFDELKSSGFAELLSRSGCVLLRSLVPTAASFTETVERLVGTPSAYRGNLTRSTVPGFEHLYSTTGADQRRDIPLHGEMFYTSRPPRLLCFYCREAPLRGGQTTVCDGVAAADALQGPISRFFDENPLRYIQVGEGSREPDHLCRAFVEHEGRSVFINSILPTFTDELSVGALAAGGIGSPSLLIRTESGGKLPLELVVEIRNKLSPITLSIDWVQGDVLIVDNRRAMHGRRRLFEGPRQILVQLID